MVARTISTYLPGHASHVYVLAALGQHMAAKNVVEYGSGLYSTIMCFLNRGLFPQLRRITVYEPDPVWRNRVMFMSGYDSRIEIAGMLPINEQVRTADLVFIDNGPGHEGREQAIEHCLSCHPQGLIVLHDAQEERYTLPLQHHMRHMLYVDHLHPATALFWNDVFSEELLQWWLSGVETLI